LDEEDSESLFEGKGCSDIIIIENYDFELRYNLKLSVSLLFTREKGMK
jgi:hypothetical protein